MLAKLFALSKKYFLFREVVILLKKINPRLGLKKTDVILAAFPKSGSTWFRFIINNIISIQELNERKVDYKMLNGPLRASYDSNEYPKIVYKSIPRFVATHRAFESKRFSQNRKIYLYRNPGDTMVSFYEYRKALKGSNQYTGSFSEFIREKEFGIKAWCSHYISWQDKADFLLTYEGLKNNPDTLLLEMFEKLHLDRPKNEVINYAIIKSNFKNIRQIEENSGLDENAKMHLNSGFRFARKGVVGEWKNYFNDQDLVYLKNTLDEYGLNKIFNDTINSQN